MKVEWKSNSTDTDDTSGMGTLKFDSGSVKLRFSEFTEFHRLTGLIQREIDNAVWHGREALKRDIEKIKS